MKYDHPLPRGTILERYPDEDHNSYKIIVDVYEYDLGVTYTVFNTATTVDETHKQTDNDLESMAWNDDYETWEVKFRGSD